MLTDNPHLARGSVCPRSVSRRLNRAVGEQAWASQKFATGGRLASELLTKFIPSQWTKWEEIDTFPRLAQQPAAAAGGIGD